MSHPKSYNVQPSHMCKYIILLIADALLIHIATLEAACWAMHTTLVGSWPSAINM